MDAGGPLQRGAPGVAVPLRAVAPRRAAGRKSGAIKGSAARRPLSVSMGDYLKAVWELAGDGAASTKQIAGRLGVRPASVTNMLGRLRKMGLVEHERYRGASLTRRGREEALRLVRRHRLIEIFLTERLGYPWQEVHEAAQKLEHGLFDEGFAERLAEHLGHPERDPYGAPIPAADGFPVFEGDLPLSEAEVGGRVLISRVRDEDGRVLDYLAERGITPGKYLAITETRAVDSVVIVEDEKGHRHPLGLPVSASIFVRDHSEGND